MTARSDTARMARLLGTLALGVGLALALLGALMLRSTAEGPDAGHRITAEPASDPAGSIRATQALTEPHIELAKNEGYYGAAGVAITEVTSLFIDQDEAWSRYQLGEQDTIAPPDGELGEIKASPVYSPQLHVYPGAATYAYAFSEDVPPFDDPLVRAAFASAIDRRRLISEALTGDELPALTFTPPTQFGHVDGYAAGIGRPYAPTLAQTLLAASGYTGTPTITLMYDTSPKHQAVAEAVRQMWIETLGITVTLRDLDRASYLALLNHGSASERPGIFRLGWRSDYPDAHNWHQDAGGYWFSIARYDDPAYNAIVDAAAMEPISATRSSLYEQAEAYLVMTDTAIAPLYYSMQHALTRLDLSRTYRAFGGQQVDAWAFAGTSRPLEVTWGYPTTLDPAVGGPNDYTEQLFLGLTDFDDQGNAVPELATGWNVSGDGTVYTFTLRGDALWSDGSPVTAYDVEYGVLRSLDPDTGSSYAYVLSPIENAAAYNGGSITDPDLVGVRALDATHICFTLTQAAAYFPLIAGMSPARPQPQSAIAAHGRAWTDPANIVTNGPYTLAHWDQSSHLRVSTDTDGTPTAGEYLTFTVDYGNDGDAPADGCVITDTLYRMWYVTDTSPFTHTGTGLSGDPLVYHLGTLPAHASGQFTVVVQVSVGESQGVYNTVEIATSALDDRGTGWEKAVQWYGEATGDWMRVDYGNDFVGGVYPAGHSFWITVTDGFGTVKATATVASVADGAGHGYWGYDGFVTESADWLPAQPDIGPDDRVAFQSDDGYMNTIRVGTISGVLAPLIDSAFGSIDAPWFTRPLWVVAGAWGFTWRDVTVDPAHGGFVVDFAPEDLQPGSQISVEYFEPDGDKLINLLGASSALYLPVVLRTP